MKKLCVCLVICFAPFLLFAQNGNAVSIIPQPVSVATKAGYFQLPNRITIGAPSGAEVNDVTTYLKTESAMQQAMLFLLEQRPIHLSNLFSTPKQMRSWAKKVTRYQ